MRAVLATVILAAACAAVACAKTTTTALTPEGAHVRVSDSSVVGSCEYLGDFVGGASGTSRGVGGGWWEANQVRNLAAERAPQTWCSTRRRGAIS
jgi:hypothetical protein